MLVLSRKTGESIVIGNNIRITISEVKGQRARIGIEAPKEIPIQREEVREGMDTRESQAELIEKALPTP